MAKKKTIKFNDGTTELKIDVDIVIDAWNAKNPNDKLTRTRLAKIMDCNKQVFVDWKSGKTPRVVYILLKLMEIGECSLDELLIKDGHVGQKN